MGLLGNVLQYSFLIISEVISPIGVGYIRFVSKVPECLRKVRPEPLLVILPLKGCVCCIMFESSLFWSDPNYWLCCTECVIVPNTNNLTHVKCLSKFWKISEQFFCWVNKSFAQIVVDSLMAKIIAQTIYFWIWQTNISLFRNTDHQVTLFTQILQF